MKMKMRKRSIAGLGALVLLALSGCSEPVDPSAEGEGCLDAAYAHFTVEEASPIVEVVSIPGGFAGKIGDLITVDGEGEGVCETTRIIPRSSQQPEGSAFSEWYYNLDKVTPNENGTCNFIVDDEVVTESCVFVSASDDPKFQETLLTEVSEQYSSGDWGDAFGGIGYYKIGSREPAVD